MQAHLYELKRNLLGMSKRLFHSQKSHNMINYVTLKIKDPEIEKALTEYRMTWLDRVYKPLMFMLVFNQIYCIFKYFFAHNSEAINLVMASNTSLFGIVWTLFRWKWKSYTIWVPMIFLLIHAIDVNLVVRD